MVLLQFHKIYVILEPLGDYMRIVPKTFIKTTLLAFLSCLVLSGCSQFGHDSTVTASVSFSLNAARAAAGDGSETFDDVELQGDYKASKTVTLTADKIATVTFDNIPVGKSVNVAAQIYTMYDDVKLVLYAGESEKKALVEGENQFAVPMQIAYNSIAKGTSSCVILKPLFTSEATNTTLKTNKLDFTSESETFSFKVNTLIEEEPLVLDEYQKAIITIKGAAEGEHTIRTKFVKSPTAAMYYQDPVIISTETKPYELIIPQGIKLDSIGFENSWNDDNNGWASDYSFIIESIELIKDPSLVDPDFNVVTQTASTYTVKNPAMQKIANAGIAKNKISFAPTDTETYCAAYWEPYDTDLGDYDKITITYSLTAPEKSFRLNGYLPRDYSTGRNVDKHSNDDSSDRDRIETHSLQETKSLDLRILTNALEAGEFKAIEFKYDGTDPWDLQIQEIKLEKISTFDIQINVPADQDINVDDTEPLTGGTRFKAPEGFTSYEWKLNGAKQTEVTGNVFDVMNSTLLYGQNDVSLRVYDGTNYYSWQAQINKAIN